MKDKMKIDILYGVKIDRPAMVARITEDDARRVRRLIFMRRLKAIRQAIYRFLWSRLDK